jgi:hypothetical protein
MPAYSPYHIKSRRVQELQKKIKGLPVALLRIRLKRGDYRIFLDEDMDLGFP